MRLPRFVLGMLCALAAFASVTYWLSGSFWQTVAETLACAVLIQIGYFLVVVLLVSREPPRDGLDADAVRRAGRHGLDRSGKISVLRSLRRLRILP